MSADQWLYFFAFLSGSFYTYAVHAYRKDDKASLTFYILASVGCALIAARIAA